MKKSRLKTKPVEKMRELADIVKNSETDEIALEFLKDAWENDFPDLDLAKMDLHEASKVLGGSEMMNQGKRDSYHHLNNDLNDEFSRFMAESIKEKKASSKKAKSRKAPRRKRRKRR